MSMICSVYAPTEAELRSLLADPERIHDFTSGENQTTPCLGMEKTWHGLHYLLTGSAWEGEEPLCFLAVGGELVGDIDVGYGPARAFHPDQVQQLDASLARIEPGELRRRFNPVAMMREGIYPSIWDRDPQEDDTLGELIEYYEQLARFIHRAAEERRGLVVTLD